MAGNEQIVDNPFGFWKFIEDADSVDTVILAVLVAMSLASWYVILTKFWDQSRIRRSYAEAQRKFWAAGNLRDGMTTLTGPDNVFHMLAEDGIRTGFAQ